MKALRDFSHSFFIEGSKKMRQGSFRNNFGYGKFIKLKITGLYSPETRASGVLIFTRKSHLFLKK